MILRQSLQVLLCLLVFCSAQARSESYKQEWDAVPDAEGYEYEVYENANLKPESIVRQGKVDGPRFDLDLRTGVYFYRIRAIEKGGRPGRWSSAIRGIVKAVPPLFKIPLKGEKIEIPSASTPIYFEWTSVEAAMDYEIRLTQAGKEPISQIVVGQAAAVPNLGPGTWQAKVMARLNGQPISVSESVNFDIEMKAAPRPRFLEPVDGALLTSFEMNRVRWSRLVPGKKSEVIVTRADKDRAVVSHEPLDGKNWTYTTPLKAGRYQITVRDFIRDGAESSDQTITVIVEDDPFGYHSRYIGTTWRLFSFGALVGKINEKNYTYGAIQDELTQKLHYDVETSFRSRIWREWGLEGSLSMGWGTYIFGTTVTDPVPDDIPRRVTMIYRATFGPTYRIEPWGPTKPIHFKALALGRGIEGLIDLRSASDSRTSLINSRSFSVYGLSLGSSIRWGGWNSRYDLLGEAYADWPFLKKGGNGLATGSLKPFPGLSLTAFLRRKWGEEWRLLVGGQLRFEKLSLSESAATTTSTTATSFTQVVYGPRIALEVDL